MQELTDLWWGLFVNRTDGTIRAGRNGWIFTPEKLTLSEVRTALEGNTPSASMPWMPAASAGGSVWMQIPTRDGII